MRYLLPLLLFSLKALAQEDTMATFSGTQFTYHTNGFIKCRMTYKNGVVNGPCVCYNSLGYKTEEGVMRGQKWIGEYRYYYENGHVQQRFLFDERGKRAGLQRFYYPNGILQVFKKFNEKGQEDGYELMFDMNGNLQKKPAYYINGDKVTNGENPEMLRLMLDIAEKENAAVLLGTAK